MLCPLVALVPRIIHRGDVNGLDVAGQLDSRACLISAPQPLSILANIVVVAQSEMFTQAGTQRVGQNESRLSTKLLKRR
jgi:hypothetical protein